MTQQEKLLARLNSIDLPGLYEVVIYITPEKTIAFWIVKRHEPEGEMKRDIMRLEGTVSVGVHD